jgi:K+-sensing histidine kinase KdpD
MTIVRLGESSMNCLILDDNPVDLDQLAEILKSSFARNVDTAQTIDEAIEATYRYMELNELPDLIFVDIKLADGENGLDFVRHVKRMRLPVSIIVLTGLDDGKILDDADHLGVDVISKSALEQDTLIQSVCLKAISRWSELRRQQLKDLSQYRQQLLEVVSNVAHDMINAVNSLHTAYRTLALNAQRAGLDKAYIDANSRRLSAGVEHASYLAELCCSFGAMANREADLRNYDVSGLVERVIKEDVPNPEAFLEVVSSVANPFPLDEKIVRHLFRILSENIVKHCPPNTRVAVQLAENIREDRRFLEIDFIDDGPGVAPQYRDKIFEPAGQANDEKSTSNGYGLGLAAASRAIAQHKQGEHRAKILCIDSPLEVKGACFRMIFPGEAVS